MAVKNACYLSGPHPAYSATHEMYEPQWCMGHGSGYANGEGCRNCSKPDAWVIVPVQAGALLNDMGDKYKQLEAGMDDNAQVRAL